VLTDILIETINDETGVQIRQNSFPSYLNGRYKSVRTEALYIHHLNYKELELRIIIVIQI
jgi:hypothetical protein